MELNDLLTQIYEAYEGNDIPCDYGCSEKSIDIMIKETKIIEPYKPYCIVENWIWLDFSFSEADAKVFTERDFKPCLVRSKKVIEDEAKRLHIGTSVRSTWLRSFHNNCIFMTQNTSYILVGKGSRVSVSPEILSVILG